jgi:hypothetical protein
VIGSCQRALKRTLRQSARGTREHCCRAFRPQAKSGFPHHGERAVAADRRRPAKGAQSSTPARGTINRFWLGTARKTMAGSFAQILGKLYFFNLRENLRHILFDYEEKRSCTTNGAFKSAC